MHASSLVGFFTRDLFREEVGRMRSTGDREIEVLFVRFEGVANILGFITEASGTSGQLRILVGIVQIVVFSVMGIFYWIRAYCQEYISLQVYDFNYSDYCREIVCHGAGNVVRGIIESFFSPMGNWIVILYSLSGERMRYSCEEARPNRNIFDAVIPSPQLNE